MWWCDGESVSVAIPKKPAKSRAARPDLEGVLTAPVAKVLDFDGRCFNSFIPLYCSFQCPGPYSACLQNVAKNMPRTNQKSWQELCSMESCEKGIPNYKDTWYGNYKRNDEVGWGYLKQLLVVLVEGRMLESETPMSIAILRSKVSVVANVVNLCASSGFS